MRLRLPQALIAVLLLFALLPAVGRAQSRESLSLDGIWDFATDLDSQGEIEKWYAPDTALPKMPLPGYAAEANGKILVPGIWDNQGYGTATDKVQHNFVGKGWYKRQVEIPATWAGRRVFLIVTGVNRYSKTWVNGRFVGEHIGCVSSKEWDITPFVVPSAPATITIQVDSKQRWEVDSLYGTASLADYMDVPWGGIWGHVLLEARSEAWLSDLFVQPSPSDSSCSASATLNGNVDVPDGTKLQVFDASGKSAAETTIRFEMKPVSGQPIAVTASLPGAALWTPDSPALYTARLSLLKGNDAVDAVEVRFGMRQFTIDGFHILLNGKRLMLRGYGDDHIYPEQMAMPSDKELYLARLRVAKAYGFNFVRNHSAIMPPEYYEACDEVGMIATAEFPICYHTYLPGTGYVWQAHALPGTDPNVAIDTYRREWTASIKRHRNHPSIFAWVRGNELYEPNPLREEFQAIARQYDPSRLYVDSDSVSLQVLDPANDRDTLDFYTVPFNEATNPLDNPAKFQMGPPKKPVISHESGNYITFSRPGLLDEFKHKFKPFWLTAGKAKLAERGLVDEAGQWADKSERLYALCHKFNTEAMRRNPCICGYQWWLLQDYWTTSNGILDHYFRPKSITQEDVLKFNNDVVLLQDGLERTYGAGSRLTVTLLISNYSVDAIQGELAWEISAGGHPVSKDQVASGQIPQGEVVELTRLDMELPQTDSPARLTIAVAFTANERRFVNDWSVWLYPAAINPSLPAVPICADETQLEMLSDWGLKPIPADAAFSEHAVYVVSRLDDRRLLEALDRGACVMLLGEMEPPLKSCPMTFRPSWWRGTVSNQINHSGTFVYDHPVTRAMAPDGWCDDGWLYLIEGGRKYSLETAPTYPHMIIRALPTLEKVEEQSLLFEVAVGEGCLIVSGLNHQGAQGRPENQWILTRLLEYAAEFPEPDTRWPASFLEGKQGTGDR